MIIIESPPPIKPAKNAGMKWYNILQTKWPNTDAGSIIKMYLKSVFIRLIFKFGMVLVIILRFSEAIVVVDKKNEIIIAYSLKTKVKPIRDNNRTIVPIM